MKKILLLCTLLISAFAFSQTTVGNGSVVFLTSDATWSGDVTMDGKVVVNSGVTLTIQPGTVIKGKEKANPVDATALVIAKGGKIMADGTAALPIIFTSEYDALTAANVAAGTYFSASQDITETGLWGGVIVLGNNVIGAGPNNTANIEGIAAGQSWTNYGGTATDENSGVLNYVSIRHGGTTIADGSEINGLTLAGVGSGTTVTNIEIISNNDDGLEIFGGNVNVTNLLVYNQTDDAIDLDQAYSGTVKNALVVLGVNSDTVFEIDGTESTSTPRVTGSFTVDGVTGIGNPNATKLTTYGDWKADATGTNKNIVYKGFKTGSKVKGIDADTFGTTLTFSNLDFITTDALSVISTQLTSAHAEVLSAQVSGTGATEDVFYDWTYYFKSGTGTLSVEDNITKTEFSVYPNPFSNNLNVSSQVKVENLKLYNISGQLVKQVKNSNSMNVSELATGIYILEVTADATREIRKVIKN